MANFADRGVTDSSGNRSVTLGTALSGLTDSVQTEGKLVTYWASVLHTPFATSTTDTAGLVGTSSKLVKLRYVKIAGFRTTATQTIVLGIKRSVANTTGSATLTGVTAVPSDPTDAAASAAMGVYTVANPSPLGAGTQIRSAFPEFQTAVAGTVAGSVVEWFFGNAGDKPCILRSSADGFFINLNAASNAGLQLLIDMCWTEE